MSAMGTRLVALLIGLAGPSDHLAELPAEAVVVVDDLEVFDEQDEASTVSGNPVERRWSSRTRAIPRSVSQER